MHPEPDLICSQCGQPEAFAFAEPLCPACYHARGSCGAVREIEPFPSEPSATNQSAPRGSAPAEA